jgi:hypothetical protein
MQAVTNKHRLQAARHRSYARKLLVDATSIFDERSGSGALLRKGRPVAEKRCDEVSQRVMPPSQTSSCSSAGSHPAYYMSHSWSWTLHQTSSRVCITPGAAPGETCRLPH